MRRKLLFCILFSIFLFSIPVEGINNRIIPNPRIKITDFDAPNEITAGKSFSVNVTVKNNRFLPIITMVRIDLLDGLLNTIKKNIGEDKIFIWPRSPKTITINCVIREGDIDWYKEKYNIQAMLFHNFNFLGITNQLDSSITGIHIKSRLMEKDKLRIVRIDVPEEIEDPEETIFFVDVLVKNEGAFPIKTKVRIYMIEKPSAIPAFEELDIIPGAAEVRKELGTSKNWVMIEPGIGVNEFEVRCELREIESKKEKFIIKGVVLVNINGKVYEVDSSDSYEIYHEQPFCRDEICLLFLIGAIFAGLIAFCLIAVSIRILYPLYLIKKTKLRDEKEEFVKKRKHLK